MSLCYLWSLEDNDQIKNYDYGGMAYATLLHFMNQLSRRSLSSLGGAPFVWQVRFELFIYLFVFAMSGFCFENCFGYVIMMCVDLFLFLFLSLDI